MSVVVAVADTTALLHLGRIGRLTLLDVAFDVVCVPPTVWSELVERRPLMPEVPDLVARRNDGRLRVVPLGPDQGPSPDLVAALDPGEAEAIALARVLQPAVVLIDERKGRQEAQRLGLPVRGVLSVLIELKARGDLVEVRPLLDALETTGFRIGVELRAEVLRRAGEGEAP